MSCCHAGLVGLDAFAGCVPCNTCVYLFPRSRFLSCCTSLYIIDIVYSHLYLFIMFYLFLSVFELCMLSWVFPSSKDWVDMFLPILDWLSRRSSNMSMHHFFANDQLHHIFDLNGIRGQDILEAAKKIKVGAIRHFIRSDVNSVQKTDRSGTSLKDVAWAPWSFGECNVIQWPDAMACNGLEYVRSILLCHALTSRWNSFDS